MSQTSTRHYDAILAERYQWLIGCSFDEQVARATEQFAALRLGRRGTGRVVDLGAGTGAHAAALAELGFRKVVAVDSSRRLIDDLRRRRITGVDPVLADITDPAVDGVMHGAELVVCLGDTLTHLATPELVDDLLARVSRNLAPGGKLVLGFRDYTRALTGSDRFIPVRADEGRSLTCMLEFGDTHVDVHDLFWEKEGERRVQRIGSYRKLRLDPLALTCRLRELSFRVDRRDTEGTMVTIVCRRDDPSDGPHPAAPTRPGAERSGQA